MAQLRSWLPKHQSMGIEHEPANIRRLQFCVEPFARRTREPESVRLAAKHFAVGVAANMDLGALGFGKIVEQQEKSVRRAAGNDFEVTGILQLAKCP